MKLILYYGLHSIWNQIRKLLKSWFIIFILACGLLGGLFGFIGAKLGENDLPDEPVIEEPEEAPEIHEEEGDYTETFDGHTVVWHADGTVTADGELFADYDAYDAWLTEVNAVKKRALAELVAGGAILVLFILILMGTEKKGLMIFQPADAAMLFPSPMTPQGVLMFRVACQTGLYLFLTLYFMIEIPTLKMALSIGTGAAAAIILVYGLLLTISTLARSYIALVAAEHPKFGKNLDYILYGLIGLIAAAYLLYRQKSGLGYYEAATAFFNAPVTRFIPLWGWLKGIMMFAIEGRLLPFLLCVAASIALIALLIVLIRRTKPDFYEEALAKTDELADMMARMQEKGSLFAKGKKTDKEIAKEDKLRKNELNRGRGAQMFFVRALYNRFRFARFGIFTKTMLLYLFLGVGSAVLISLYTDLGMIVPALILCACIFFRTLGNPLREDTDSIYFKMSPEPGFSKLFFSALGGSVNCLLDVLPALIIAAAVTGGGVLEVLGWAVFMLTLDLFSSLAGSFLHLSLPENAGTTVKQFMQMMFLYFGLIPDILIIWIGLGTGKAAGMVILLASGVNLLLAALFFALTLPHIDPEYRMELHLKDAEQTKVIRRIFSRTGFSAAVFYGAALILSIPLALIFGEKMTEGAWLYVGSMAPMYLVGLPLALLVLKRVPAIRPAKEKISWQRVISAVPVMSFFMLGGNLIGSFVTSVLSALFRVEAVNPVEMILADQSIPVMILFVVIIGPLAEEFFFRKILIDRLRPMGERTAILVSALIFGLFHGNFSQAPYAFLLGLVLGYLYLRNGQMWIGFVLHALINFFNGVLPTILLSKFDPALLDDIGALTERIMTGEKIPGLAGFVTYYILFILLAIVGFVVFIASAKKIRLEESTAELPRRGRLKKIFLNPGMLVFVLFMLAVSVVSLFTMG